MGAEAPLNEFVGGQHLPAKIRGDKNQADDHPRHHVSQHYLVLQLARWHSSSASMGVEPGQPAWSVTKLPSLARQLPQVVTRFAWASLKRARSFEPPFARHVPLPKLIPKKFSGLALASP